MDLRKYQQAVMNGSLLKGGSRHTEFVVSVLGLGGEAGEVQDLVKKSYHPDGVISTKRFIEELGDVLWYVTHLAGLKGFTLDELASLNYNKLSERYPHNYPAMVE